MNRFDTTLRRAFLSAVAAIVFSGATASAQVLHDWTGNVNNEFYGIAGNWNPMFIPRVFDDIAFSGAPVAIPGLRAFDGTQVRQMFVLDRAFVRFRPEGRFDANTLFVGGGRTFNSGLGDNATLELTQFSFTSGTTLEVDNALIGAHSGPNGGNGQANGVVVVQPRTLFRVNDRMIVGDLAGDGHVDLRGGSAEVGSFSLGVNAASTGDVTLRAFSSFTTTDASASVIGGSGSSTFTVTDSARAELGTVIVGLNSSGDGRIRLEDFGSMNLDGLTLGSSGAGRLDIVDGGRMIVNGDALISSRGRVDLRSSGSAFSFFDPDRLTVSGGIVGIVGGETGLRTAELTTSGSTSAGGRVNIQLGGRMQVSGTGQIGANSILDIDDSEGEFGDLRILSGGELRLESDAALTTRTLSITGGDLDWDSSTITINGPSGLTVGTSGLFGIDQTVPQDSVLRTTDGILIQPGAELRVEGRLNTQDVQNEGTLFAGPGSVIEADGTATNAPGGTILLNNSTLEGDLVSQGTLQATSATIDGRADLITGSSVTVTGEATFTGSVTGGANFGGTGDVTFLDSYAPGDAGGGAATVAFGGDVIFDNARLILEILGSDDGEFDQLLISGNATLGGDLLVELLGGFTPANGDTFTILDIVGTRGGMFAGLNEGDTFTADGQAFNITYAAGDGNDVALTAVPEPTSAVFLLAVIALVTTSRLPRKSR